MISDSQFSGKIEKRGKESILKKIYISLALRILLICLALIILPLLIHSFIIWRHDLRAQVNRLVEKQKIVAEAQTNLINQWIELKSEQLQWVSPIEDFSKIAKRMNATSLFYLEASAQEWICVQSNWREMIGNGDYFSKQSQETVKRGRWVFISDNPISNKKELFIMLLNASDIIGYGKDLIAYLKEQNQHLPSSLKLYLRDNQGKIFDHSQENIVLFSLDQLNNWVKSLSLFELLRPFKKDIGLTVSLPEASISLIIAIPKEELTASSIWSSLARVLTPFVLIIIFAGWIVGWLTYRMARPLHHLYAIMDRVSKGDLQARFRKDFFGFEINVLGIHFNQAINALLRQLEQTQEERLHREILQKELKMGQEIQQSLFPRRLPELPQFSIAAAFIPAKEVAGDFYDLLLLRDQKQLMIAIADGSGKGISACLYSLLVRSLLRSHSMEYTDLSRVIRLTNRLFCLDTADSGSFVTAWIGIYDIDSRQLQYSCCGHPAALLTSKQETHELATKGIALGVTELDYVETKTVTIHPGDRLFLYTDGLIETCNAQGLLFGRERLTDWIRTQNAASSEELIEKITAQLRTFSQGKNQEDDLTILTIQFLG